MMSCKSILKKTVLISLFFFSWSLYSQEGRDTNISANFLLLEEKALLKELETSTYQELIDWSNKIGLDTGSLNEASIKKKISEYYNINDINSDKTVSGKTITINRAEISKYYTIEEVNEDIVEFEGRVEIVINDNKQKIEHSIIADKVNFNRSLNSVTAIGNVYYKKTENDITEVITAESLTFNISNWQGSIIKCISKQTKDINDEKMEFYYVTGEIKKSDTAIMGMNDVTIQTVPGSPFFNISAIDLWMLDSSDFIIISPIIKIGHVPVFGAPFYYYSENNLYFNPVFGIRTREGMYLQNTIYLMGSKNVSQDESDFSFLSLNNGDATSGNKEFNSLSLIPSDDTTTYSSDYSKLFLDYYSNLGIFIGNETELSNSKSKTELKLSTGFAFSRNINDSNGQYIFNGESEWNNSYFLGKEIPFRYMLYISLTSPVVTVNIETLSDPYFRSDFMVREENFQWVNFLTDQLNGGLTSLSSGGSSNYTRDTSNEDNITEFSWSIDVKKYSPKLNILKPFISSLSIDLKEIEINFESKISKEYNSDNSLSSISYENYDPSYKFFYPDTAKIPLIASISGTIFNISDSSKNVDEKNKTNETKEENNINSIFDIENPTKTNNPEIINETKINKESLFDIKNENKFDDEKVDVTSSSKIIDSSLTYSLNLPLNLYAYWDNNEWYNASYIDLTLTKNDVLLNFDPYFNTQFNFSLLDSVFTVKNITSGNKYYKTYLDENGQADLLTIYKWNKSILENELLATINLLNFVPAIKNHSVEIYYEFNTLLYKNSFDQDAYNELETSEAVYLEEFFNWTEDYVNDNKISLEYTYDIGEVISTVSYTKVLPPFVDESILNYSQLFEFNLTKNIRTSLDSTMEYSQSNSSGNNIEIYRVDEEYELNIYNFLINLSTGFEYSFSFIDIEDGVDAWDYNTFDIGITYSFIDNINLSLESNYSFEDDKWSSYNGTLSFFDIDLTLSSSYAKPVSWNSSTLRWVTDSNTEKVLNTDSLTIEHNWDVQDFIFWKNRITIDIDSSMELTKEFIKVDQSSLAYSLDFRIDIYEFLSLEFSSKSTNDSLFQYFDVDSNTLGLNYSKNFFIDLMKSFNFFNNVDRLESSFNLSSISVDATYKMPDWNLVFSYEGYPELIDTDIEWYQIFSFFIEWKPLSIIRTNVENDDKVWSVSTSAIE